MFDQSLGALAVGVFDSFATANANSSDRRSSSSHARQEHLAQASTARARPVLSGELLLRDASEHHGADSLPPGLFYAPALEHSSPAISAYLKNTAAANLKRPPLIDQRV